MNARLEKLQKWLKDNVMSPSTPKVIILSDFEFNIKDFKGSFKLILDSDAVKERFCFGVEIDGRYEISPPFQISPLGVPSSFPKIELTDETNERIERLINDFFPRIKPLGIDKKSGLMIDRNSPMIDRIIDVQDVTLVINKIKSNGFKLKSELK
jgi:hypothetical protein